MAKKTFRTIYDIDFDCLGIEYRYMPDEIKVSQAALTVDQLLKTNQRLITYHDQPAKAGSESIPVADQDPGKQQKPQAEAAQPQPEPNNANTTPKGG